MANELRRYERPDGSVMHLELRLDDSVVIISERNDDYPPNKTMLYKYVPDVETTFDLAIANGWEAIEKPVKKGDDPDKRGSFYDFAGNF